jgi:ribosomal protein S18 acetylase RimI-like enzyme
MDVVFRPAKPDDAEAMVPLVYSSGPLVFEYVFSHRTKVSAKEYLYRVLQQPGGEFGYEAHIVGTVDGKVVATGAGYTGATTFPFLISAVKQIFGTYGIIGGFQVSRRGLHTESVIKPPKGKEFCVSHLGVDPEMRGRGIGEKMVNHLLENGRELGGTKAVLDVSVENPRAEALYTKMGFVTEREMESNYSNDTGRVMNHRRMVLDI